jgi:hypothetical protein
MTFLLESIMILQTPNTLLENVNTTTNIIGGKVALNDLLAGIGYRFRDEKFRCF